jgi:hypothetical protein
MTTSTPTKTKRVSPTPTKRELQLAADIDKAAATIERPPLRWVSTGFELRDENGKAVETVSTKRFSADQRRNRANTYLVLAGHITNQHETDPVKLLDELGALLDDYRGGLPRK